MNILEVEKISKVINSKTILATVSFSLRQGETLAVMGPSGSGKTTLLRIIAGLEKPSGGAVIMKGKDITDLVPEKRNIGFVFQEYALFPHMTVFQNVAFPLKIKRFSRCSIAKEVHRLLDLTGMFSMKDRKPSNLSGGEKQRVAIIRSVINNPEIMLLDEPFSSLDRDLVDQLQGELWKIRDMYQSAMILVTHDCSFALSISDRILILNNGKVEQTGRPQEIFERPKNKFVAQFLGRINLIPGYLIGGHVHALNTVSISRDEEATKDIAFSVGKNEVVVAVRPNFIILAENGSKNGIPGTVKSIKYRGTNVVTEVSINDYITIYSEQASVNQNAFKHGDSVSVWWHKEHCTILTD